MENASPPIRLDRRTSSSSGARPTFWEHSPRVSREDIGASVPFEDVFHDRDALAEALRHDPHHPKTHRRMLKYIWWGLTAAIVMTALTFTIVYLEYNGFCDHCFRISFNGLFHGLFGTRGKILAGCVIFAVLLVLMVACCWKPNLRRTRRQSVYYTKDCNA
jgi:hypothetical protein